MARLLAGKTAIVTSAANGIGLAIARYFNQAGAQVMLADRNEDALAKARASIDDEGNAPLAHFPYEQRDKLGNANLLASTIDRFGRIDILVNGAHMPGTTATFLDLQEPAFHTMLSENVFSVFQLSQMAARRMISQAQEDKQTPASGAIVNISSIASRRTVPELLAYSVSCAALDQLTRSMAAALASYNIRVNGVALGSVMNEQLRRAFEENDTMREEIVGVTPLGRVAEPGEAAEAALFLASPQASFVTGQIISVDGGRTLLDPLSLPLR